MYCYGEKWKGPGTNYQRVINAGKYICVEFTAVIAVLKNNGKIAAVEFGINDCNSDGGFSTTRASIPLS